MWHQDPRGEVPVAESVQAGCASLRTTNAAERRLRVAREIPKLFEGFLDRTGPGRLSGLNRADRGDTFNDTPMLYTFDGFSGIVAAGQILLGSRVSGCREDLAGGANLHQ